MTDKKKKLFIKTWGCQMNVYDSHRMADVLRPLGYAPVDHPENADMVILNTCHIREKATDKVFSELGRLREYKEERAKGGEKTIIAVAGCVAQAEGDIIMKRAKYVDMVFGPQSYHELPQMVMNTTGERIINTEFPVESKFDSLPEEESGQGPMAFVSVQEGCDKFCTFCVVPYTRGAEYSRTVQGIIDETKRLRDTGAREVTLLGQNVNAFHGVGLDGKVWNLARLIAEIAEIDGIDRIRYTTSHPRDMDNDLIDAHRDIQKLMPFLHLPVQSGSNSILKAMNRKHEVSLYMDIIARVRAARPDMAFSSDFIVGFPGETEEDFEATMKLVRDVNFAASYSFSYSARPGTPAAVMKNLVAEKIKNERLLRLQALLREQQHDFNQRSVGLTMPVLFDQRIAKNGQIYGRTPYNQGAVTTGNPRLYGQIVPILITAAFQNSVLGQVVTSETVVKSA